MSVLQESNSNEKEDEVYFNFINSIRADETKRIYQYNIKLFMKFCNVVTYHDLARIENPQTQVIQYLISLREKCLKPKRHLVRK